MGRSRRTSPIPNRRPSFPESLSEYHGRAYFDRVLREHRPRPPAPEVDFYEPKTCLKVSSSLSKDFLSTSAL